MCDLTLSDESATVQLPYAGLRVVDLSDNPAGDQTAKFLADLGADVLKIEPPTGSPLRRWSADPPAGKDDATVAFWYYNTSKRSAICDPASPEDRAALRATLQQSDVVVSTLGPQALRAYGVDPRELTELAPGAIVVSITPFGLDGPRADWVTSDLVSLALGGLLNSCGYDDHSIPPVRPGENQAYHCAASFGHIGLLLALLHRQATGEGQLVDISMHECIYVNVELANPYWFYPRSLVHRQTCRHAQPAPTQPSLFECADGRYLYFALIVAEDKPWTALVQWLDSYGMAADLADEVYSHSSYRHRVYAHVHGIIEAFFLTQPAHTMYREGQEWGLPIGILNSPADVLDDGHLRARRFFRPVELAEGVVADLPSVPLHFSAWATPPPRRPPRLGEHSLEFPQAGASCA